MLASFQGSHRSRTLSPPDNNMAVTLAGEMENQEANGTPKRIVDIVRRSDPQADESRAPGGSPSMDEYLIQTQRPGKEGGQTPLAADSVEKRPPLRHTLKKRSKPRRDPQKQN